MTLKVAAYARVSTDKEDQINSLINQREYFEEYIKAHDEWEYAGVFFDEGVTGTQTKKREGFNRMIERCKEGRVDLILTKEVSRFARNTVDALNYTRMLREYNVGVLFINDNIDTRDNDGEFRLSIMASVAQEESRKISERVKWGQKRAMENGVVFGNNSLFGYNVKDGALTVNDTEAEVVRCIFHKYADEGKGTRVIARELYEENISPPERKSDYWSSAMILRILRNEKYVGDLLQKKYITKDYITHKKTINDGEKIFIPNHHTAIVNRDIWERAQAELKKRSAYRESGKKYSNRYWCSGKIICGECGGIFTVRRSVKKSGVYITWGCVNHIRHGRRKTDQKGNIIGCDMRMVNNKSLLECMRFVTGQLYDVAQNAAEEVIAELELCGNYGDSAVDVLKKQIEEVKLKKLNMLDGYFEGKISAVEMEWLKERYDSELTALDMRLEKRGQAYADAQKRISDMRKVRDIILNRSVYSESVYGEILDRITVNKDALTLKLKYVDFAFNIIYSTHGYKDNYTTRIDRCSIVSDTPHCLDTNIK